jgi:hypothetical protein
MKHLKTFEGFYLDEIKKIKASTIPQIEEVKKQFQQNVKEIFNIFEDEFNYDSTIENEIGPAPLHLNVIDDTNLSMSLQMQGFKKEEMDKVYDTLEIIHNRAKSENLQFHFEIHYIIPDKSNPDNESWDDDLYFGPKDEDEDGTISEFRKRKEIQKIEKGNVRKRIITIFISDKEEDEE